MVSLCNLAAAGLNALHPQILQLGADLHVPLKEPSSIATVDSSNGSVSCEPTFALVLSLMLLAA